MTFVVLPQLDEAQKREAEELEAAKAKYDKNLTVRTPALPVVLVLIYIVIFPFT